jgi:hypothetical protein
MLYADVLRVDDGVVHNRDEGRCDTRVVGLTFPQRTSDSILLGE